MLLLRAAQGMQTNMTTRILLTGTAGFIGAHTLEHLLEHTDWHIIGVDSLVHAGKIERVNQVINKVPEWTDRFEFIKADLSFPTELDKLPTAGIDYIINMASESHVDRSIEDPVPFIKNNVDLTVHMLEYARNVRPNVFIQISTDEVYGPMQDEYAFLEWEREIPSNPYSASKAAQEMIAISYWRTYGVPLVITNTMNNIGEMQDVEKFVPMLIRDISQGKKAQVHGTPEQIGSRFYLHARNHADALLFILRGAPPVQYGGLGVDRPARYNIVGDTRLTNLEVAERIAALLDKPLEYELVDFHSTRPGHDLHYGLNGSLLESLGWKPPLSFEDSLKRTVDNYLEHPEWLK